MEIDAELEKIHPSGRPKKDKRHPNDRYHDHQEAFYKKMVGNMAFIILYTGLSRAI